MRRLAPGEAEFLSALIAGRPLGEAAGAALESHPGFNIGAGIATLIEAGAFVCCKTWRQHMTSVSQQASSGGTLSSVARFVDRVEGIVRVIALPSLVQLVLRFALAVPFWKSGILKWDGFLRLSDTAVTLFTDEFMLHLPGGPYPFPAPAVMAFLSGCAEITFPVLLVLGLATRFAALGLLFMTLIVELTVPDGWPVHITWAAMALAIIAWGPGRVSLDFLIRRALGLPDL